MTHVFLHFLPFTVTSPCCKTAHIHVVYSHAIVVCVTECVCVVTCRHPDQIFGFRYHNPICTGCCSNDAGVGHCARWCHGFPAPKKYGSVIFPSTQSGSPQEFVCRAGWKEPLKILEWPSKRGRGLQKSHFMWLLAVYTSENQPGNAKEQKQVWGSLSEQQPNAHLSTPTGQWSQTQQTHTFKTRVRSI